MSETNNTDPAVVATRSTFDGVIVSLHEDGALSTYSNFIGRVKLPVSSMWRHFDNVCLYTIDEIPLFIRSVKAGRPPSKPRPSADESERIIAWNSARRMESIWGELIYSRSPWRS